MLPLYSLLLSLAFPRSGCLGTFKWSYRDFGRWEALGECALDNQCPIDVPMTRVVDSSFLGPLAFWSARSIVQAVVHSNAHTWEVVWPQDASSQAKLTFAGRDYFLRSFDFHSPSENTIDGQYYAMEAQLLHKATDGQMLVLSVMLEVTTRDNPYLEWYIWSKLGRGMSGGSRTNAVASPYADLLPEERSYLQWDGSLTAPPCTTNVTWIMLTTPINISHEQLTLYRTRVNDMPSNKLQTDTTFSPAGIEHWDPTLGINIRPTQPLEHRQISRYIVIDEFDQSDPMTQMNGWYVLLLGLMVGVVSLCLAASTFALINQKRHSCDFFENTSRAISRNVSSARAFSESMSSLDEEEATSIVASTRSQSTESEIRALTPLHS